jgi:hypothetical protein
MKQDEPPKKSDCFLPDQDARDRAELDQLVAVARASEADFAEGRFQEAGTALRALAAKHFPKM